MSVEQHKALARRFYELIDQGEMDTIVSEIFTEDFKWDYPGIDGYVTPEDMHKKLGSVAGAFSDMDHPPVKMVGEGNMLAARVDFTGTHTGPYEGVPASGNKISFSAIDLFYFENGRVKEILTTYDLLGLLGQMGVEIS